MPNQTPPGSTEPEDPPCSVDQTATDKEKVAFIAKQATAAFFENEDTS
jgi:hypothetical protein